MVVDFRLVPRVDAAPGEMFGRGRTWYGWDASKTEVELFEVNRGDWSLGDKFEGQSYATFSFDGEVRFVASVAGKERVDSSTGPKWAVTGHVLPPEHPASVALLGMRFGTLRGGRSYHDIPEVDSIPLDAPLLPLEPGRPGWLLVWNPAKGGFADLDEALAGVAATGRFRERWSCGRRTSGIEPGDRVFLFALGAQAGIVGTGWAASRVFQKPHWQEGNTGDANYVLVDWDTLTPVEGRLDRAHLKTVLPDVAADWEPRSGGVTLTHPEVKALASEWAKHTGNADAGATHRGGSGADDSDEARPGGQGTLQDAERRKKIEDAAQDRLTRHYEDLGYDVEDVRYKGPYDAIATRHGETLYLEAKGTTTPGDTVIVTRNEVAWARNHPDQCVIGIWAGIQFNPEGSVAPEAGTFTVHPWDPNTGALTPRDHDWTPPVAG